MSPQPGPGHLLKQCNHLLMEEEPELRLQSALLLWYPTSRRVPQATLSMHPWVPSPLDYHGALSVLTMLSPQLLFLMSVCLSDCSAEEARDTFPSISLSSRQAIMTGQVSEPRDGELVS